MKTNKKYALIINEALRSALDYDTPEEQIDGAEQLPEDLCRARKGDDGQVMKNFYRCIFYAQSRVFDGPAHPDEHVFCGEAQRVEQFAQRKQKRRRLHFHREAVHVMLGLAAEPMPPQQAAALDLRPA